MQNRHKSHIMVLKEMANKYVMLNLFQHLRASETILNQVQHRVQGDKRRTFAEVFVVLLILFLIGSGFAAEKSDFQFSKQPEIQQVRPKKPVKIKLHRNAKGEYSWDLTGDDADEIAQIDRKLRRLLKIQ